MALRPAKCYKKLERPYTRQSRRKPRRGYVKGVPDSKIRKFEMGEAKKDFSLKAFLVSNQGVQIRHNALEAARVTANKYLDNTIGKENYFLKILVYPHHVLRENRLATGAGADRFQTGMRKAFGKPIGTAARVRPGQNLMEVRLDSSKQKFAKDALRRASAKFPTTCRVIYEKI
ncbi:MAG: 50S ribosomal protein L16 [Candidatus Aenigmarchaeota archaeon]|nr:50S ribosomal protein L16 [Candidatus Aenigmarchaeota archaeon]